MPKILVMLQRKVGLLLTVKCLLFKQKIVSAYVRKPEQFKLVIFFTKRMFLFVFDKNVYP